MQRGEERACIFGRYNYFMELLARSAMRQIILLCCCIGLWSIHSNAQSIKRSGSGETSKGSDQNQRIWYGGNLPIGLGFGSQTLIQFGISPMLGYKLTPNFSVGPRVGFLYSYYSQRLSNGQVLRAQPLTWTAGVFSRYKFVEQFFGHVEYEYANQAVPYYTSNGLEIQRINANNIHVGIGLLQGGMGSARSEILLLYNVNPSPLTSQSPLSLRFGLNWHF